MPYLLPPTCHTCMPLSLYASGWRKTTLYTVPTTSYLLPSLLPPSACTAVDGDDIAWPLCCLLLYIAAPTMYLSLSLCLGGGRREEGRKFPGRRRSTCLRAPLFTSSHLLPFVFHAFSCRAYIYMSPSTFSFSLLYVASCGLPSCVCSMHACQPCSCYLLSTL